MSDISSSHSSNASSSIYSSSSVTLCRIGNADVTWRSRGGPVSVPNFAKIIDENFYLLTSPVKAISTYPIKPENIHEKYFCKNKDYGKRNNKTRVHLKSKKAADLGSVFTAHT